MDFKTIRLTPATLVEIAAEQFEYMRNVLPPLDARGCFAMGEPVAHTRDGVTFHWAGRRGDKSFVCYGTRAEAEAAFIR